MPEYLSDQLNSILKETSRAFYLSLALLEVSSRRPLSLAYLLARAADTVADSECREEKLRRPTLLALKEALHSGETPTSLDLVAFHPSHSGELRLLESVPALYMELNLSSGEVRAAVAEVVGTLIDGMIWDQELFAEESRYEGLQASELERYTYMVAGCVGPFWSYICGRKDERVRHLNSGAWRTVAVEFGKALQWVNILRDVPKDQLTGRYYLPALDHPEFGRCFAAGVRRALTAFDSAVLYPLEFPVDRLRDRVATFLLLVLGYRTLEVLLLEGGPRPGARSKVSRTEVLSWAAVSAFAVVTSRGYRYLMSHLKARLERALSQWEKRYVS